MIKTVMGSFLRGSAYGLGAAGTFSSTKWRGVFIFTLLFSDKTFSSDSFEGIESVENEDGIPVIKYEWVKEPPL